jgi:L-histidine Nalpha-methyltransferase
VSPEQTLLNTFAADVVRDLQRTPKQLQARYLYDALGSSLFDAICRLPWYRITRAEARLLRQHAGDVAAALLARGAEPSLVELGCGSGEKLEVLVRALPAGAAASAHLIDISAEALQATAARVSAIPRLKVWRHEGTYEQGLAAVRARLRQQRATLVLFLGSNIGNFDRAGADALLEAVRDSLQPGALFLLGADLVKPREDLLLAYDDPLGVTAAFNRNLLVRINRELDANFDLSAFAHRAVWNEREHRVEMHLVSLRDQHVHLGAADVALQFARGETIWTESSYKYSEDEIQQLGAERGFSVTSQWIDAEARFALTLFTAV